MTRQEKKLKSCKTKTDILSHRLGVIKLKKTLGATIKDDKVITIHSKCTYFLTTIKRKSL